MSHATLSLLLMAAKRAELAERELTVAKREIRAAIDALTRDGALPRMYEPGHSPPIPAHICCDTGSDEP